MIRTLYRRRSFNGVASFPAPGSLLRGRGRVESPPNAWSPCLWRFSPRGKNRRASSSSKFSVDTLLRNDRPAQAFFSIDPAAVNDAALRAAAEAWGKVFFGTLGLTASVGAPAPAGRQS